MDGRAAPAGEAPDPVIETVVTTLDEAGAPNFAAMGVVWGDAVVLIRPFPGTRTFRNLEARREAVVNVTDDVLIFAKSALSRESFDCRSAERVRGVILGAACHWREVEVVEIRTDFRQAGLPARAEVATRVVASGVARPFVGLCRGKHAVVEASILASRLRLRPRAEVLAEIEKLEVLVEKTGGRGERQAMAFIRAYIARRGGDGRSAA
jgi:hypothetical protein